MPGSKNNQHSTRDRGQRAETLAASYLTGLGYVVRERNFCWKGGEIDLIAHAPAPDRTLVLVEVRSSSRRACAFLRYTIGPAKRLRLVRTVGVLEARRPWSRSIAKRFDLIWIEGGRIEHWKNVIIW